MLNLTLIELKQIAKMRGIKGYNNMSKERSFSVFDELESIDNAKLRNIKKDFNKLRDRFLKPKIKEIRKNHNIESKRNFSASRLKVIEKNLFELEESLSKLKSILIMMLLNTKE